MTEITESRIRNGVKAALPTTGLLIACAVLLLWAWNGLAVDLFDAPPARIKHAIALEAALAGFALLAFWTARLWRRKDRNSDGPGVDERVE